MGFGKDLARVALGSIRLTNGVIGLVAPHVITRRFTEEDAPPPPAAVYALRMFGIRTILVGLDLLRPDGEARRHAMHAAPMIHASDLATAILIARSGLVPKQSGRMLVAISGLNTLLALYMQKKPKHEELAAS